MSGVLRDAALGHHDGRIERRRAEHEIPDRRREADVLRRVLEMMNVVVAPHEALEAVARRAMMNGMMEALRVRVRETRPASTGTVVAVFVATKIGTPINARTTATSGARC